jgi:hypothetical protein
MVWGQTDCVLTVASAVEALTGEHPAPAMIGSYKTEKGALGRVKRLGGLDALATRYLGEPLLTPRLAQRGDVVLFALEDQPGKPSVERLGLCEGATILARGDRGLARRPMRLAIKAWPVGR